MKIGIAVNFFNPSIGGSQVVAQKIAEYISKKHEVFVFTRKNINRKHSDFNYKIIEYNHTDYNNFSDKVKQISLDVLFIYSDVFDFFRQIITTDVLKYKLVIAPCGSNWVYSNRMNPNLFYRNSGKISSLICHSFLDRDYKLCSSGELKNKCTIIPNGVDLNEFDNNKLDRYNLLQHHHAKQWIVNVSNFFPGKGQEHMVDILNEIPNPDTFVYIQISSDIEFPIGEQLESSWKKSLSRLKKPITSVYMKNLERSKVVGFIKQANALALTSEKEVSPVVILEAMAASTPWVSTDVGNVRELKGGRYVTAIKNYKYHSIFDERVKKLFSRSLQEVLETPLIGSDGRYQIEKNLTWDKILPKYLEIFEQS